MRGMENKKQRKAVAGTLTAEELKKTIGGGLSFGAAEAYKLLRTNLEFSLPDESGCKVIGITSSLAGEGKSTTSVNLGYTMAQTGKRVLLLEADMRLPTLAGRLKVEARPGLSNLLIGQCSFSEAVQRSGLIKDYWVLCAGDTPPNPAELLNSKQMRQFITEIKKAFDMVIIDLPPIEEVSDALIVSRLTHGVVLVVRQDYCNRRSLDDAVRKLKFANARILGFAMTGSDIQKKGYHKDYYKKMD